MSMKRSRGGTYQQQQQKKRSKASDRNKKQCHLGKSCPYQHEYQHRLEFSHDNDAPTSSTSSSSSSGQLVSTRNFQAFSGNGFVLGGAPLRQLTFDESLIPSSHSDGIPVLSSPGTYVVCETCNNPIELKELERHCAEHEQRGDFLRRQQEEEYEAAMIADAKKEEEKLQAAAAAVEAARKKQEEEEVRAAIEISKQERWRIEMIKAKEQLLPEPSPRKMKSPKETVFSVRFTLPDGRRLMRKFTSKVSIQDAFNFIRANYEVEDNQIILRSASSFGGDCYHVNDSDTRSFGDIGITTNTSLIVVLEEKENVAISTDSPREEKASPTSVVVIDVDPKSPDLISSNILQRNTFNKEQKPTSEVNNNPRKRQKRKNRTALLSADVIDLTSS